jgi:hypothetical protein
VTWLLLVAGWALAVGASIATAYWVGMTQPQAMIAVIGVSSLYTSIAAKKYLDSRS